MKLEYSIPPEEDHTDMTYKKFLRIVHKQIASANAGFPNSKIIALVGAAWKDYKAEMLDKDLGKDLDIFTYHTKSFCRQGSELYIQLRTISLPSLLKPN